MAKNKKFQYDCAGWVSKDNVRCTDGTVVRHGAFKHQDGVILPLVYMHNHDDVRQTIGKILLESRDAGTYGYASFNNTQHGLDAKECVAHGDLNMFSICAKVSKSKTGDIYHGNIKEVSLVLAGADPQAIIEVTSVQHSDDSETLEAVITGLGDEYIMHSEGELDYTDENQNEPENNIEHKEDNTMANETNNDKTVGEVWDGILNKLDEDEKTVLGLVIAGDEEDKGDDTVKHNAFDDYGTSEYTSEEMEVIQHCDDFIAHTADIFNRARNTYGSLKDAVQHAQDEYGVENIDFLFPDYQELNDRPEFVKRDTDWVGVFMGAVGHKPFAKIRTTQADITADEARAKGYIKGNMKKEEFFPLMRRETGPCTIYKKQKVDRDDLVDMTWDLVAWLKQEMRIMLDEEIARACLVGDGRTYGVDEDAVNPACIRPIYSDTQNDFYAVREKVEFASGADSETKAKLLTQQAIRARKDYKGSGNGIFFTSEDILADLLLLEDDMGHRLYKNEAEVATALRASRIVTCPFLENLTRTGDDSKTYTCAGIFVNPKDYVIGQNNKGAIQMFDDFDIDFNQYKYLMETRMSGALVKPKSALIFEYVQKS